MTFHRNTGAASPAVIAGASVLGVLIIGGLGLYIRARAIEARRWAPIVMPERIARVTGEWDAATLAGRLQKSNKVREAVIFVQAAQEAGITKVEPGGYLLPEKAGPRELAQIFKQPPALKKLTFPEGWTVGQMTARLAQNGFAAANALRAEAYPNATAVSSLEGRLFPDTYYLAVKDNADKLVSRLRDRFTEVWRGLPKDPKSRARVNGVPLTDAQVIVLASLIERESTSPQESPLIAGVLINRLNKKMRLQCDASVQYARMREQFTGALAEGHKARLLFSDLKIDSPYNTYRIPGLPPGAICNPGATSLRAALMPKASPYFFYVMSPKLKAHRFAATFAEHQHNIRLAQMEAKLVAP